MIVNRLNHKLWRWVTTRWIYRIMKKIVYRASSSTIQSRVPPSTHPMKSSSSPMARQSVWERWSRNIISHCVNQSLKLKDTYRTNALEIRTAQWVLATNLALPRATLRFLYVTSSSPPAQTALTATSVTANKEREHGRASTRTRTTMAKDFAVTVTIWPTITNAGPLFQLFHPQWQKLPQCLLCMKSDQIWFKGHNYSLNIV